jgi:hypothetical protein
MMTIADAPAIMLRPSKAQRSLRRNPFAGWRSGFSAFERLQSGGLSVGTPELLLSSISAFVINSFSA